MNSILPLIEHLLEKQHAIHLSVVTETGMACALQYSKGRFPVSFLPWDIPLLPARFIRRIHPKVLLLTETEFWPHTLKTCARMNVPVIGINTRISDRSFPRYMATRRLWQRWLKPIHRFLAQSNQDAKRLQAIGIEASRICTPGNLKYIIEPPIVDSEALRRNIDASAARPVLLVASSHEGEEQAILNAWHTWQRAQPDLLCILAPRHPERFESVANLLIERGIDFYRWSDDQHAQTPFVLLDAMGVLRQMFTIADIAIIAGSIAPIGGHNPLEATICGRGVVTGPYVQNFQEIMQDMQKANAAIVCQSSRELETCVEQLLTHPDQLQQLHAHAIAFMQDYSHILDDYDHELSAFIDS